MQKCKRCRMIESSMYSLDQDRFTKLKNTELLPDFKDSLCTHLRNSKGISTETIVHDLQDYFNGDIHPSKVILPLISNELNRKTITLIGSTNKALKEFRLANLFLTLKGFIVLTIGCDTHSDADLSLMGKLYASDTDLELLHFDKIMRSDAVLVLNPLVDDKDYIGKHSGMEIYFTRELGKEIWWLNVHDCDSSCYCKVK